MISMGVDSEGATGEQDGVCTTEFSVGFVGQSNWAL